MLKRLAGSEYARDGAFLALLALDPHLPGGPQVHYPLRVVLVAAVLLLWSRKLIRLDASRWGASVAVGLR